jgi:FlaA1/EpsC-like NDP-sugar epimerase
MEREEAAKLVVDTLVSMTGGEVAIPDLPAFQLGDLALAMRARVNVVGLDKYEKLHESMDESRRSETARRMGVEELTERLKCV